MEKKPQSNFEFKDYLKHLFDLSSDTDKKGTVTDIEKGISIRGHNAWILIFSILVASVGLNLSSTAVVIGAMLISPLMGPILGLGMSLAINDLDSLKKSLANLGTMTSISIVTSFLFFSIPLFQEATPELLSRTKPDIRDVLIAFSGGLALIVALSRRSELTNSVAGVAIATALMPPLCTAGFGLAVGNFSFFAGAFFLYIINSTFIALATYLILKFLKFPSKTYLDSSRKKNIIRIVSFVSLLILLGSIFTFYELVKENQFVQKANRIVELVEKDGYSLIEKEDKNYDFKSNEITLTFFGKNVSDDDLAIWYQEMKRMGLTETKLKILQNKNDAELVQEIQNIRKTYNTQFDLIRTKDEALSALKKQIAYNNVPLQKIAEEARINYSELEAVSFARKITYNFKQMDTVVMISSIWKTSDTIANSQYARFEKWIKSRLDYQKIEVIRETPVLKE